MSSTWTKELLERRAEFATKHPMVRTDAMFCVVGEALIQR